MSFKNYYAILGVAHHADTKTIQSAYRKLARKLHPDSPQYVASAEQTFHEVDEAYEVLRDPTKRAAFDQKLAALGSVLSGTKARKAAGRKPYPQTRTTTPVINMQIVWGAVALIMTILAAFIITELPEFVRFLEYQQKGVATEAVVIRTERQSSRRYLITMAYEIDGISHFNTFVTGRRDYGVGSLVSIKYLVDQPDEPERTDSITRTFIAVIGGTLIWISLPCIILLGVQFLKFRHRLTDPNPTHATP